MPKWNDLGKEIFEVGQQKDLDLKSFNEVYATRKKWVQFTLIWDNATGQYKRWWEYCKLRNKYEKNKSATK